MTCYGLNIFFRIKRTVLIILFIGTVNASAQNTLYFQGFEGTTCENWNFSGGIVTAGVSHTGNNSGRIGYISNTLTFSPANVAGYANLVLTIYHSVKSGAGPGMDTREGAVLQISLNGGAYISIGSASGFGDANWSFNSTIGGTTNGSAGCTRFTTPNPVVYSIPNGTTSVQARIVSIRSGSCGAFNTAMTNATPSLYDRADEGFYIDDIKITTTTPRPSIILISATGTDTQTVNTCIPQPITDIIYSTGPGVMEVTGLPPGVTYAYAAGIVTISGSPSTDGVYNYTVKNICTDSFATGSITKTTPAPKTENTTLIGCNSVILNGITYTSSIILNDTIKSFQGCDSLYNITNIIVTTVTPTIHTTNLNGCNGIVFNGITFTSSIVLNDTIKSFQGCDSLYNITNIVLTPITPTTHTTNLSGCNSIVFNGIAYTSSIVLNDTIKSFQGCDSLYNITNIVVTPITPTTQTTNLSGCNSIVFNGTTYSSSIVLNDTIKSFQGCDSLYNITNIVVTPITPTTQTTNLRGCNSVAFNGITYSSSIVLNDTIKSFHGCDSLYNITNIVVASITPTTHTTNLSGCNSIVFNGITFTSSIVLNDTIKSFQGCDSLYNITNILVTTITPTTNTTNLIGCNTIVFNGTAYTSSIVLNDSIKSFQGCDSLYNITNILVTTVTPTTHTTNLGGCNSVVFNGITFTSSIVLNDTIKSFQGCDSLYNITNIVVTTVTPTTHTTNLIGCNSVAFNGITFTSSIVLNDTIKSFLGCDSLYNITNIVVTTVTPTTHTTNLSGCNSVVFNGITFTSSIALNDTIKSFQGCDSLYNIANIMVTTVTPTTHTTNLSGCNSVVFNGTTFTSSIVLNDTIKSFLGCDSLYNITKILVTQITPTTQTTNLSGCNSIVFNGTTYSSSVALTDTIKSFQGCDSLYNITKIVVTTVTPTTHMTNLIGCNSVVFNGTNYSSSIVLSDTIRSYQGCDSLYNITKITIKTFSSSIQDVNICVDDLPYIWSGNSYTNSGIYTATFSNSSGCDSTAYLNLKINATPNKPFLNNDTILCPGSTLILAPHGTYDHYLWQDNSTGPTFTASGAGNYSVKVFSAFGCFNSASVSISVNANCDDIYFPSAFSPASITTNQRFGPLGNLNLVSSYSLYIYNRWGEVVFFSADKYQKWDGKLKGLGQNTGTFIWQANYTFRNSIKRQKKGYVVLVR